MKKLILSLFLLLVASSYAVPNFVNSKRAEERGYKVVQDTEGTVSIQKVDDESATTISYWYGVKNPDVAELNKVLKEDATRDLQSKGSLKMGKAYVEKYTDGKNYMYTLVFKNAKPEDVLTSVAYYTKKEIPKSELNKYVDKLLAESEKYIKGYKVKDVFLVGGACSFADSEKIFEKELGLNIYKPYMPIYITPIGIALAGMKD